MKLVNTLYNLEFDLMENQILVLSIENHWRIEIFWKNCGNNIKEKREILFCQMGIRN